MLMFVKRTKLIIVIIVYNNLYNNYNYNNHNNNDNNITRSYLRMLDNQKMIIVNYLID